MQEDNAKKKWIINYNLINEHNQNKSNTFTLGLNEFSDMTHGEFVASYFGAIISNITNNRNIWHQRLDKRQSVPDWIDWRLNGYVTDVEDKNY